MTGVRLRELKRVASDPAKGDVLRQAMGEFFREVCRFIDDLKQRLRDSFICSICSISPAGLEFV